MKFLRLLLSVGLILVTIANAAYDSKRDSNKKIDYRLPNNIIPIHYDIKLTTYIEEDNFTFCGETSVNIRICSATIDISLHMHDLEINETATTLIKNDIIYKPIEHIYNNKTDILTLKFNEELSLDLYKLNMKFVGNISDSENSGFIIKSYTDKGENKILAFTQLEPIGARRIFPSWDEPALKATFNISVKHHQKYKALSNMPIRAQNMDKDGMMWTHFNTTPIMSTYLVAIVLSDYVRVSNADGTVNMWGKSSMISQIEFAHSVAEKVEQLLIRYTNISRQVPKMDHVTIPSFLNKGMENWGLIIYSEEILMYNNNTDPTFRRTGIASLVAHELVHQWFGNLVTPSWWSDLWLSEGFAVFLERYLLDKIFDWRKMEFFVLQKLHLCFGIDTGSIMDSVTMEAYRFLQYESLLTHEVYIKAPVILRMLQHVITDDVFRNGIIIYLATHKFGSVTSDDLWIALQDALDKSEVPHDNYKIKEVMDTWIKQKSYPLLNVTRNYTTGEVIISQRPNHNLTDIDINIKWWVPVTFATQTNPNFSNTLPRYWLRPQDQNISFQIDTNDWIIVNLQQTGYYRVNYDYTNWQRIVRYLNSEEYTKIHVLNRVQIINDAFTFWMANELNASVFFNITNYLSRETDYVAWYPMFQILTQLLQYFIVPESEAFKLHVAGILNELLQNTGYEENFDDDDITKMKRVEATKWACLLDNPETKKMINLKLKEHLEDPDNHKLPLWWQTWTYCCGMMRADQTTWNKLFELYQQTHDRKLLTILSCSQDPDIIINYLNIIALNTSLLHGSTHFYVFNTILDKQARNNLILDYVLENLEIVKPKLIAMTSILRIIISHIFSQESFDKINRFVATKLESDSSNTIQAVIEKRQANLERSAKIVRRLFPVGENQTR
ncbi:hypothetical protein P5V15_007881 [Pogonomyrmex californicus]